MRAHRPIAAALAVLSVVAVLSVLLVPAVALAVSDPYREQQWALDRIGADVAWAGSDRGAGVVVAVIDTGVDLEHPDLVERFVRDDDGEVVGLDLVDGGEPRDEHGHGTLVAGIIAATADNGEGVVGVAPRASLLPVRVLDRAGAGAGRDVDTAIRWAVDQGAHVINLSLESVKLDDGAAGPGAPTEAVRYAWDRGVVVVAAAGNDGAAMTDYPPDSPVLLVGAVDRDDQVASFSTQVRDDAVLAPGVEIVSTWCRPAGADACEPGVHTYGMAEGTSFAAPHVAGAIALLRSAGYGPEEAVERLRVTAVDLGSPGSDAAHGHGRIDVGAAVMDDLSFGDTFATDSAPVGTAAPAQAGDGGPSAVDAPEPAEPTPPPAESAPIVVDVHVEEPEVQALPIAEPPTMPSRAPADGVVHLVAAVLLGVSLASWSAVARRHG